MKVDAPFQQWWTEELKRPPIEIGQVIPIQKALQGHPESPRLWDKYITKILIDEMGFTPTTHEPCLYFKYDNTGLTLILRQVDDFLIANDTEEACDEIRDQIQQRMTNPLNILGTVRKFNGVNIDQTRDFNHVHCQT